LPTSFFSFFPHATTCSLSFLNRRTILSFPQPSLATRCSLTTCCPCHVPTPVAIRWPCPVPTLLAVRHPPAVCRPCPVPAPFATRNSLATHCPCSVLTPLTVCRPCPIPLLLAVCHPCPVSYQAPSLTLPCYKISRLCHGPTTIEGIQHYLYILGLSDKAEIPAPLHNDYYSARTGRAFQRQGLPLPWTARNHHVRKRAAVCIQVLETPMLLPEDRPISVHCIISSNRQSNRVNECSNGTTPIDLHQEPIGRLYRLSLSYHVHRTPQGIGFNHTISVHHQLRLPPLL